MNFIMIFCVVKDEKNQNTHETLEVSEWKRNTSTAILNSEEEMLTGLVSDNLELRHCNTYRSGYEESADELLFGHDLTRNDTVSSIEKIWFEASETSASLFVSRNERKFLPRQFGKILSQWYLVITPLIRQRKNIECVKFESNFC